MMKKNRIGLILASIHSGSASHICSSLIKEAELFDSSFYIFPGGRLNAKQDSEFLRNPIYKLANKQNLDGLISWASAIGGEVSLQELNEFHKQFEPLPYVTLSQRIEGHSCVTFDAYSGMAELVKHFINVHNIKKIAFLRGPENHSSAADRYRAFCDTMAENGIPVEGSKLISDPFEWREGKNAIIQLYEKRGLIPGRDFSALICASDLMAFDAIDYLHKKGFVVPDDYLAAGFNDISKSKMLLSALTTVHMPYRTMGINSYELILNELDNSASLKRNINLFAPLVIRESCGCSLSSLLKNPQQNKASDSRQEPDSVQNSKVLTAEEVNNAKENLINDFIKIFRLDMTSRNAIVEPILNALWSKNTSLFLNLFSRVIKRFFEHEMDVRIIYRAISLLKESPSIDCNYITSLEKDIFIILEQVSERHQEETKALHEERTKILDSLKCALISEHSFTEFIEAIRTYLPQLGINSAGIVLYEDNKSRFLGGFSKSKILTGEEIFDRNLIVPEQVSYAFNSGIYIVQPIFADNKTIGHFICSLSFFDGLLFEDLRSVISSAFSGIFLFTQLTEARKAAEEAEQAKTKFFATVGTDLALPLSEIEKNTAELEQLLLQRQLLSSSIKEVIDKLKTNIQIQMERTNLIVDLTRSQINEMKFNNRLFYAQELFIDENEHSTYKTDEYPVLFGDKMRLRQSVKILAENFNFSLNECNIKTTNEGLRIDLPFGTETQKRETWDKADVLFATQILLMQGCDLVKDEKNCQIIVSWPNFECKGKVPAVTDQNELVIWDFADKTKNEIRAIYNMRKKDDFLNKPFLCYTTLVPDELENYSDFCSLFENSLGLAQKPVLLVGCPEHIEDNWNLPVTIKRILNTENLNKVIEEIAPSAVVINSMEYSTITAIRNNPRTEISPVVVIAEKFDNNEQLQKLLKIRKVIFCNLCVAVSKEFGDKLRALLAGETMLSPDTGAIVKKTIVYFNNHGNEYISRWKLSESAHTSEDYLTRVFHKETGLSPWEYLSRIRINFACVMLRQTNESIFNIAEKSGFQDQAYFCRVFRKITGTTPGRYRKGIDKDPD